MRNQVDLQEGGACLEGVGFQQGEEIRPCQAVADQLGEQKQNCRLVLHAKRRLIENIFIEYVFERETSENLALPAQQENQS